MVALTFFDLKLGEYIPLGDIHRNHKLFFISFISQNFAGDSTVGLECTSGGIINDTGTLADTARAECIPPLPLGHTLHRLHISIAAWQWLGSVGFHLVSSLLQHWHWFMLFESVKFLKIPEQNPCELHRTCLWSIWHFVIFS